MDMGIDNRTIGLRVKQRREGLSISQERLGEMVGVTYQQIQKYENGKNKVSAVRLYKIAETLNVPMGFFFEATYESDKEGVEADFSIQKSKKVLSPLELELVDCFRSLPDEELKSHFIELLKSVSKKINLS